MSRLDGFHRVEVSQLLDLVHLVRLLAGSVPRGFAVAVRIASEERPSMASMPLRRLRRVLACSLLPAVFWITAQPADASSHTTNVPSALAGVSCLTRTACMAVGSYGEPNTTAEKALAEWWNGTTWSLTSPPTGSALDAVDCVSDTWCMAVGTSQQGFAWAERWNGSSWRTTAQAPAAGFPLTSVSCTSTQSCLAVGGDISEIWNGSTWTLLKTPTEPVLNGVACSAAADCAAVGEVPATPFGFKTSAMWWNGSVWVTNQTQNVYTARQNDLEGVSCTTRLTCIAVGYYMIRTGPVSVPVRTLAEFWNGRSWTIAYPLTAPGGLHTVLLAIAPHCYMYCITVGSQSRTDGTIGAYAESWNGSTHEWFNRNAVTPTGAREGHLTGVSCLDPIACMAVGYTGIDAGGYEAAQFSESWNGTSWQLVPMPTPS